MIVYEASQHPDYRARIEPIPLKRLPFTRLMTISTLYVPSIKEEKAADPIRLAALSLTPEDILKR